MGPALSPGYTRLSGQDASFLSFEGPGRPMHIGGLALISSDGWLQASGELDTARLHRLLVERARAIPGLDRTLDRTPLGGWPIWISNPEIDWDAQVGVTPPAASETEIRAIAEQAMAAHLDRERPLWKVLVIPGAPGAQQFALVFLAHHALVDGIAGIDLITLLLDRRTSVSTPSQPPTAKPPSRAALLADEIRRWTAVPGHIAASAAEAVRSPRHRGRLMRRGMALLRTCVRLISPGPTTVLRGKDESGRSVTWFSVEEGPLRMARKRLGGTPNDLVLAAVASAIHAMPGGTGRLHIRRLRAAVPVSFRTRKERFSLGNRIGLQLLPVNPRRGHLGNAVSGIRRQSEKQKRRGDAEGYEVLGEVTAWTGQWSQRLLHWIAGTMHSYAILVTNVPGPSRTYRLDGAAVEAIFPLVPLFGSQSISVAVVRYGTHLRVGLTSSWTDAAMVEQFSTNLRAAFDAITRGVIEPEGDSVPVPNAIPLPGEA